VERRRRRCHDVPVTRGARGELEDGSRHSPDWYDQRGERTVLVPGDRMFIPCEGGPSWSRLERFPPRLEVEEAEGTYVLVDEGPRDTWRYVFVPRPA
jgi:hypothetical protein